MLRSLDAPEHPVACTGCNAEWHAPTTPAGLWWALCRCLPAARA